MKIHMLSALLLGVLLFACPFQSNAAEIDLNEIDLRAASSIAAKYNVKDATLEEAVREFFRAAGHAEYGESLSVNGPKEARISLDLENVGLPLVLRYVSELAACYPAQFRSLGAPVLQIEFKPITMIDDSDLLVNLHVYPLTKDGAARLGLKKDMTFKETGRVFISYGLTFLEDEKHTIWWNANTETLAVRSPKGSLAGAIAHLANQGFRLVKDNQ